MFPLLPFTLYPSSSSYDCSYTSYTDNTSSSLLYPPTSPPPPAPDEGCKLLDAFALLVQLTLASSALGILVYKRRRERPQRPVEIWALDVSKQFIGAAVIHSLNLVVSYLVGRPRNGPRHNLCSIYFLNVLVDCTLGVVLLWGWLRILQWFLETQCHFTYVKTGNYGPPPLKRRLTPWLKQTLIFIMAEGLMKFCVYLIFRLFPILFRFGEWALRWTKGNYRYQVLFVMLIFPLLMNGMQFWIVDTFVKMTPKLTDIPSYKTQEHDEENGQSSLSSQVVSQDEHTPLLTDSNRA